MNAAVEDERYLWKCRKMQDSLKMTYDAMCKFPRVAIGASTLFQYVLTKRSRKQLVAIGGNTFLHGTLVSNSSNWFTGFYQHPFHKGIYGRTHCIRTSAKQFQHHFQHNSKQTMCKLHLVNSI